jgi:hypothetical protein
MRLQRDFFLTLYPADSGPDYSYLPGVAAHPHKWRVLVQRDLASRADRCLLQAGGSGPYCRCPQDRALSRPPRQGGDRRACRSVRASEMTAHAASVTKSSIATSLRVPAAAESGNSCVVPQAVNARTAISRMKPSRRLGGCAMLTAAIAPATSSSGAAEAPAWWVQRTLPPVPSAVTSRMLPDNGDQAKPDGHREPDMRRHALRGCPGRPRSAHCHLGRAGASGSPPAGRHRLL